MPTQYSVAESFQRGLIKTEDPKDEHKVSWNLRRYPAVVVDRGDQIAREIGLTLVLEYQNDSTQEILDRREFIQQSAPALYLAACEWRDSLPADRKWVTLTAFINGPRRKALGLGAAPLRID